MEMWSLQLSPSMGIEMVQIPAGTLTWGRARITLSEFKMGKFTVTQELYQAIMGVNPSYYNSNPAAGEIQGKRPVEMVTWYDAIEFCNKLSEKEGLTPVYTITGRTPASGYPITAATVTANWNNNGYRLPTEAQWEYACRAGTTTRWHFGNTESQLVNYAWYDANSNRTHEVGKKLPNAWGLYDMYGNVWECMGMYGSGAGIGMEVILLLTKQIIQVLVAATTAWSAAGVGTNRRLTLIQPTVHTPLPH